MSMKENVSFIKEELNSEEKFIESFVKVERFYKKNKLMILSLGSIVVLGLVGFGANSYITAKNKNAANEAYTILLDDINNSNALQTLKSKNAKLAQIIEANKAKQENKPAVIDIQFLKELYAYETASATNNIDDLSNVVMQNDFILKEYALFQKAMLQAQKGQYKDAKETIKLIPKTSQVQQIVVLLNHFLLTK